MGRARDNITRSEFQKWLAIPRSERLSATGIQYQKEFAEAYNVDPATLSKWKAEKGFMDGVEKYRTSRLDDRVADVYNSMVRRALEGDMKAAEMVLRQSGRYRDKRTVEVEDAADPEGLTNGELAALMASVMSQIPSFQKAGVNPAKLKVEILQSLGGPQTPAGIDEEVYEMEDISEEGDSEEGESTESRGKEEQGSVADSVEDEAEESPDDEAKADTEPTTQKPTNQEDIGEIDEDVSVEDWFGEVKDDALGLRTPEEEVVDEADDTRDLPSINWDY